MSIRRDLREWAVQAPNTLQNPLKNEGFDGAAAQNQAQPLHVDPDLAAVVDAWASLPASVRAGILAMVRAVKG